jgi:periplasmic protein TonB
MRARRALPVVVAALLGAALGAGAGEPGAPGAEVEPSRIVDAMPEGPSVAERLAEIQRRVQRALVYPPIARKRGIEGEATVAFRVGSRGSAEEVAIVRSSGHPALDRAAERAVTDASPLPYVYGELEIPVRFVLREAH